MPIFVYVVVRLDGSDGETLEIEQGAGDAPLTKHPLTGAPLRRKTAGTDPNAPESFRKPRGNELLPHEDSLLHGESCSCAACRRGKK